MDTEQTMTKRGMTVFQMKIIACITMFLDHLGAVVLRPYTDYNLETMGYKMMRILDTSYEICRSIGRMAFPIFCFMLVEGFFHTSNRVKHLIRLAVFAVIADPVFDYAFDGVWFCWEDQSVMVTMTIGFVMLMGMDAIHRKLAPSLVHDFLLTLTVAAACGLAYFAKCDYSYKGILAIAAIWLIYPLLNVNRFAFSLSTGAFFAWEWFGKVSRVPASLSPLLFLFYNGQRGRSAKYFFYVFYPAHLLFLAWLLRVLLY
ncbi:MAG: conjugal transfer protein TraX [Lachnospiraceae bacterium]|nr:conjugal transfer protein TraX [Lachnospiraceae bacterium]